MRKTRCVAAVTFIVASAAVRPAIGRGIDVEPEAGTAGVVSAEPRPARVSQDTRKRNHEVSARWAIEWQSDIVDARPRGDRMTIAGDGEGGGRYAIVSVATGKIERTVTLPDCSVFAADAEPLFGVCGKNRHELAAIDPETLETLWRRDLGGAVNAVSAGPDLTIVAVRDTNEHGAAVAIAGNGVERWRTGFTTDTDQHLFVVEARDRLYVYEADPVVWALDRATGKLLWKAPFQDHIRTVRVDETSIEVTHDEGRTKLDAAGAVVAQEAGKPPADDAVVEGDWSYTRAAERDYQDGRIKARNRETGATWRFTADRIVEVEDGLVYLCGDNGILHAVHADTGKAAWWADTGMNCPVTVAGGRVFSLLENKLFAFDPAHPSTSSKKMTVRGSFDEATAGLRVWIGDRMVKTDRKGRFKATVKERSVVTVRMDPRDVDGSTDAVLILEGDNKKVELTSWYEDCH